MNKVKAAMKNMASTLAPGDDPNNFLNVTPEQNLLVRSRMPFFPISMFYFFFGPSFCLPSASPRCVVWCFSLV